MSNPNEVSDRAIKHILDHHPRAILCPLCGETRPQLHIEDVNVADHKNQVRVKVQCYRRRHYLTTRTLKLNEVRFIEESRPWAPKSGGDQ